MTGESYDLALFLAQNNVDLLEDIHEAIMADGISENTYAKAFSLMYYTYGTEESCISYSSSEKEWRQGDQVLSDIKLITALNQSCELVRAYTLASWENCVFSAWMPRKEVQKAEDKMSSMESLVHAKEILVLASNLMQKETPNSTKLDWTADEDSA